MNCPACGEALTPATDRCPACGGLVAPPTEGALAPDPASRTPPASRPSDRIVEIPGLKRREPTWKDEVRERMKHRRHRRGEPARLPLFDPVEPAPPEAPAAEDLDLPLRAVDPVSRGRELALDLPVEAPWPDPQREGSDAPAPLERPASLSERLEAAAVDLVILGTVWVAVVYFAGRAARSELPALLPAWPYLVAFLAFLGLAYATAFTGLTGQTPGKMLLGLRVVDGAGGRPGPPRAALRVVLAVIGIAALGLGGFAMLLDPARRAVHDRLLKTRVVRS